MATQWLSINDVKRLVKQKLYWLETGSKPGDSLIYDRISRKYVGHIESSSNTFHQDFNYITPTYVVKALDSLNDNEWNENNNW